MGAWPDGRSYRRLSRISDTSTQYEIRCSVSFYLPRLFAASIRFARDSMTA
jgi:hypothetical protein